MRADCLDPVPDSPGVYVFYGVNDLPIYVGKSKSLRERIRSHFSSDYRSANDARLSAEIRRFEFHVTAGEFGALLLEAKWIAERLPLNNKALRTNADRCVLRLAADGEYVLRKLHEVPVQELFAAPLEGASNSVTPVFYGPFGNKRISRLWLEAAAGAHGLCWSALKLERREGPCFAHQVGKCRGLCATEFLGIVPALDTRVAHDERLRAALEPMRLEPWPFAGRAVLFETDTNVEPASSTRPHECHVFDQWCHVTTVKIESDVPDLNQKLQTALAELNEATPLSFNVAIFSLIRKAHAGGRLQALI
jgi:DNA polymerase III subunit epsilon